VNGDNISMLDTQILADNTVHPSAAVIKIVISQNDQHRVFSLLALNQNCVTTEELEGVHGVVGQGDDGVVIVDGIRHTGVVRWNNLEVRKRAYMRELGFFFFFRIAVAVSSA
jgi:hypothetical protein